MKNFVLSLSLVIAFCSQTFAQTKAIIKGPTEVFAGTLLFLSHEDAVGDNKVWIIPEELKSSAASCASNIFFSIPSPGTYSFGLIVADKQANIEYAFHKVVVKSLTPTTPIITPPTPTPVPTPVDPSYNNLRKASITGLKALQDPTTTEALRVSLLSALDATKTSTIAETKKAVQATVGIVFGNRPSDLYRNSWYSLWRVPVDKELALIPEAQYREAIKALTETLCKDCLK
jgi:hypothetical protein